MENIMEKMSNIDKTVWTRLSTAITPHLNKIQREEDKLKKQILTANEKIATWKEEISDYKKMMKEIEDKYRNELVTETETQGGIQGEPQESIEESEDSREEISNDTEINESEVIEENDYDVDDFDPFE